MSNLEPIDDQDLDLASKFGKNEKPAEVGVNIEKPVPAQIEKEPAKEVISAEKDSAYNKILSRVQSKPAAIPSDDDVKSDAATAAGKQDAEGQVQHLVDIALNKGVIHAVKVAQHMEDNYILDMFHDKLLADELHDALLRKGLIEEI